MNFQEEVSKIKDLLTKSQEVLVALNKAPNLDSVAASLALYLGLKKINKKAKVFCEDKIRVEFGDLIAVDKITDSLAQKNFVISLDYKEGSIDKVSYNIEGDKFNLVVEPRPGSPPLTPQNVHYSSSGATADLIFVVDTPTLSALGKIYEETSELFPQEKIVNISSYQGSENFGKVNLVIPQAASTSEIVALLCQSLGIRIDQDMATNLLLGLEFGSKNFTTPKTNATTFEMAALCLRAGGKRISSPSFKKKTPVYLEEKKPSPAKALEGKEEKAPPDWLRPKIYKGSTLV